VTKDLYKFETVFTSCNVDIRALKVGYYDLVI